MSWEGVRRSRPAGGAGAQEAAMDRAGGRGGAIARFYILVKFCRVNMD